MSRGKTEKADIKKVINCYKAQIAEQKRIRSQAKIRIKDLKEGLRIFKRDTKN